MIGERAGECRKHFLVILVLLSTLVNLSFLKDKRKETASSVKGGKQEDVP